MKEYKVKVKNIKIIIFCLTAVFAEILNDGNLNLLYFLSIIICPTIILKRQFRIDIVFYYFTFLLVILLPTIFFNDYIQIDRVLVYCIKILLCIILMSFIKSSLHKVNMQFTIKVFAILLSTLTILSLFQYARPPLWRTNDLINGISPIRLKLTFSEPSVLGLLCSILLLIVGNSIIENGFNSERGFYLLSFLIPLILSFSISAYIYTVISIVFLLLQKNKDRKIRTRVVALFLLIIVVAIILLNTNNSISARLNNIMAGNDGSFNFRWSLSLETLGYVLKKTKYRGLGLSNMNTSYGLGVLFAATGMDYKFPNSFMYFVCENGIFGVIYIFIIIFGMIGCIKKSRIGTQDIKSALLFLIIMSQLVGGYFTDPFIWICYGIISSKETIKGNYIV